MRKKLYLLTAIMVWAATSYAQQILPLDESAYLSQINQQIEQVNPDNQDKSIKQGSSEKLRLVNYLLLSEFYAPTDSVRSKEALDKVSSSASLKLLNKGVLAYYQGIYYAYRGQKLRAIRYYEEAIQALKDDNDNLELYIKCWYNYGYLQIEEKGYQAFIKTLTEQCIPLCQKSGNKLLLAYAYTQVGLTFMSVGQTDKAQEYHFKALDMLQHIPEQGTIHVITYFNLVSNYCYMADSRSAKIYLDKATALLLPFSDSRQYPNYYYQLAMYYTTTQEYARALGVLRKGIIASREKNQNLLTQMMYFRMYNVYLMQQDYPKAKAILEQLLNDAVLGREPMNRKITITQLAAVNEAMGNYKEAYLWMKKVAALSDSIQQQKLLEKMNELELIHDTHQKESTISRLLQEKNTEAQRASARSLRTTFLAVAFILSVIIALLAFTNYRNQRRLNQQIRNNHLKELQHVEQEKMFEASKAVLKGEEQERQRIAQDLHDSMGGMLANIRMSISSLALTSNTDILAKIDKSITEMRRISRNLMPETLKNLGLEIALKELCEAMSSPGLTGLTIQYEAFNLQPDIPFPVQLALYRITQEGLSNVIKHAQASNVIVQISQNDKLLALTIEDDGIGFDTSTVAYGLGIKNITNRLRLIQGTVEIDSGKGHGTTINIECNL
ncbi:tetratricopeptide repeat-containing sensor histidine kinase [Sphingobacterium sp. Mn56C]|uniref:tetratricopeptide repeat-containing sensor histidine kinase n=1 Tax=Sphingobacterium sp. Mn56C TaxID=3395261 RepID=UPI003BDCBED5